MKSFFTVFCFLMLFMAAICTTSFAQTVWTKDTTNNPVLVPGLPGDWDELYVQHSSVIFDGNEYHMWYSAFSNTDGGAIGHATSMDGIYWIKDSLNPVLTKGPIGSWDGDYVVIPSVLYDGSIFHIWYTGAIPTNTNIRIGYAWSSDGFTWTKYDDSTTTNILYAESDPVLIPGSAGNGDSRFVEAPAVIVENNSYTMWYRGVDYNWTEGIGRATSTDGINWSKDTLNNPVLTSGSSVSWEKDFLRLGSVVFDGTTYHLFYYAGDFYNDFRIGYAWSSDGVNWTKYDDPGTTNLLFALSDPVLTWGPAGSWDDTQVMGPWVILDTLTSTFKMWYTGVDDVNTPGVVSAIGYATAPKDPVGIHDYIPTGLPGKIVLSQNYPNPFNPTTIIEYSIPKSEFVTLKVYNLLGQEVAELVAKRLTSGIYNYSWNAASLASGVYIYKIQAGDFQQMRKMVLLK